MKRYWKGLLSGFLAGGKEDIKSYGDFQRSHTIFQRYIGSFFKALFARKGYNIILSERFSFLLLVLHGRSSVVICHDLIALLSPGVSYLRKSRYRLLLRLMNRAAAIVCISENTKHDLIRLNSFIHKEKVKVVSNGLEEKWFNPATSVPEETRLHSIKGRSFFLVVGTDAWNKNLKLVIQSFADLGQDILLVRVGPMSAVTLDLVYQTKVIDRLFQVENVSDDELRWLYKNAIALIFPSLHEGFGWPPLEAMAVGCPVIASNISVVKEVCGEAACYIDPLKKETLTEAMRILGSDYHYRQSLIHAGYIRAKKFSWQATAEGFRKIINDLKK